MRNAELNGVSERISPVGIVEPRRLHKFLKQDASLLVMDCEGAEFSLLDPTNDPILLKTNIIVEVHPEFGDKNKIIRKFTGTHKVTEFSPFGRAASHIRVAPIKAIDLLSAADERHGDKTWLYLEVHSLDKARDTLSPGTAERSGK
jgi:hypothetical protein